MATVAGGPVPFEVVRWNMAEQFGWTLEYIDGLSLEDLSQYMSIRDGKAKAQEVRSKMNGN